MQDTFKKILVVDDEQEVLIHLTNILKRAHYEVISTTKGKEAVQLAKKLKPDLIILDILIPDMGGEHIFEVLSEDPSTSNISIIFLTGTISKEKQEYLRRQTGNYCVLAKPITNEEVLETVSKVLFS